MTISSPIGVYEINGQRCQVYTAHINNIVANNVQVVAAVTGKRIRVMGWFSQSFAVATGSLQFKDGSGGTFLTSAFYSPLYTTGDMLIMPIVDCGYFETTAGTGLFVDVATNTMVLNVQYITYTP
jgi:hypothetical protein